MTKGFIRTDLAIADMACLEICFFLHLGHQTQYRHDSIVSRVPSFLLTSSVARRSRARDGRRSRTTQALSSKITSRTRVILAIIIPAARLQSMFAVSGGAMIGSCLKLLGCCRQCLDPACAIPALVSHQFKRIPVVQWSLMLTHSIG